MFPKYYGPLKVITLPDRGYRTAPSAGALYGLETYVIVKNVDGVSPGFYKYIPDGHRLIKVREGNVLDPLFPSALRQEFIKEASFVLLFCGVYERLAQKYGDRASRYTHMEVGHAAQNVHLQVVSMGLVTVVIGAFDDDKVKEILHLQGNEHPLYFMPIGRM